MGKYDFDLELVGQNSLLLILEQIKKDSVVLEFGPANGRLTKYLKQELNCDMYLVEIDEEAGKQALKFAKDLVVGDAENLEWFDRYKNLRFDYILFPDILEHLRNPLRVITTAKRLLKEDGSILVSVPNLAHNAVVIHLLNNDFTYNEIGLLDNTHIHFFTKNSLEKMISEAGLHTVKKFATYQKTAETEIRGINCSSVKGISEEFWNHRPYGEIYQYVYEAKKNREFADETENYLKDNISGAKLQVYLGQPENYSEERSIKKPISVYDGGNRFEIPLSEKQTLVRLDPMDCCGIVRVHGITGKKDGQEQRLHIVNHNAEKKMDNLYFFENNDPQFMVEADGGQLFDFIQADLEYIALSDCELTKTITQIVDVSEKSCLETEQRKCSQILLEKNSVALEKQKAEDMALLEKQKAEVLELLEKLKELQQEHEQEVSVLNKEWASCKKEAILYKENLEELNRENQQQKTAIQSFEEQLEATNEYIDNFKTLLAEKDALLNAIYHSKLWKIKNMLDRILGKK